MPDLLFSLEIDRTDLGLGILDLNDHVNYYVSGSQFFGGTVSWNRNQISSPFIDGQITTYRTKQMVTENVGIEVLGLTYADTINKISTLVAAFEQDSFNLQLGFGVSVLQYACEAADYTVGFAGERWVANQVLVTFSVPRQPVPVFGGF